MLSSSELILSLAKEEITQRITELKEQKTNEQTGALKFWLKQTNKTNTASKYSIAGIFFLCELLKSYSEVPINS